MNDLEFLEFMMDQAREAHFSGERSKGVHLTVGDFHRLECLVSGETVACSHPPTHSHSVNAFGVARQVIQARARMKEQSKRRLKS